MNKERPLISVIIPIFNIDRYISKCLLSVSEQSLNNNLFEVILVDDNSTDNSPQIINHFCKNKTNFKSITNQRQLGIGPARNVGIRESKGQFLFFIDGDDYIAERALEVMLSIAQSTKADIVTSGFNRVNKDGEIKFSRNDYLSMSDYKEDMLCEFFSQQLTSTAWGKLYKKSLFIDNDIIYPAGIHEDISVTFKLFWFANKIHKVSENLYYWVERDTSTTALMTNDHIAGLLNGINLQIKFIEQIQDFKSKKRLSSSINQGYLSAISYLLKGIKQIKRNEPKTREGLYLYLYQQIDSFPNAREIIKTNEEDFPIVYNFFIGFSTTKDKIEAMVNFESSYV